MQNSTHTHTANVFCFAPPVRPVVQNQPIKLQGINAETKHHIYSRLLELLSNPKIKPFVLHPNTKKVLQSEDGFTNEQIHALEVQIIKDAEYLPGYEVFRDAPAALYYALSRTDETNLIFENQIVPLPNDVLNTIVCTELQKELERKSLLACEGFIESRATDGNGVIRKTVRLDFDVDSKIIGRGFMLPVYRNGLISALKVFRHPEDAKPFILRTRKEHFDLEVKK